AEHRLATTLELLEAGLARGLGGLRRVLRVGPDLGGLLLGGLQDGLQPAGERGDPLGAQTAAAGRLRLALGLRTLRLGLGTLLLRLAGRYGRRRLGRGTRVEQARPTDLAGTGVLGGVLRRGTVAAGRGGTLAGHLELATSCLQRAARLLQFGALPRYRLLQGDDVVIDLAPLVSTQHDVEPGLSRIATRRLPVGAGTVVSGHRSHLLEVELAEAPGARPVWAHPRGSDRHNRVASARNSTITVR